MPEIWLRYGSTDVVLDIKFENLSSQISSNFQALPEDQIRAAVESAPVTENMLVLALSPSKAASKAIAILAESARAKGYGITVDVSPKIAGALRANLTSLAGGEGVSINRADYHSLHERIKKFSSTLFISRVGYDPLFGYVGSPTILVRNFLPERMAEAFTARKGNAPAPGEEGEPLKIAISSVEDMQAISIELVANGSSITGVHIGAIRDAFGKAVAQLRETSVVETDPVKCAVMSAGSEPASQSTLSAALNSLWNAIHIVKEKGSAILLAESREGLGGGALQMFIEGRLAPERIFESAYIDGLEHLIYMQELRLRYDIGLVSTLPQYYAKTKLGFATYTGMKDVIEKLVDKHGKNFKATVLSDADITLLKPKI